MTVFQEAADPNTPASRLAELASEHPEVRPIVALHPAAYDGLLDWLVEHGDANTQAAVAQRRATAAAPAGPPAPPASPAPPAPPAPAVGGYAAAVSAAPGSAPQAAPLPPRVKGAGFTLTPRILVIGIGALLVLALIIVAVVVVPRFVGGSGGSDVRVASYGAEPERAWALNGPEGHEGDFSGASATTVGQDRAIITWYAGDSDDNRVSLIDTRSGSVLWDRKAGDLDDASIVAADSRAVVFHTYDDDVFVSVDLGDGRTLDQLKGAQLLDANTVAYTGLPDRFYVRDDEDISAYSASDVDNPRWTIEGDEDDQVYVAGSRLIVGSDVYSTDSGSALDWEADDDVYYFDYFGTLLASEADDESFSAVDPNSGEERWTVDYDSDYGLVFARNVLIVSDEDSIRGLDPATANEMWKVDEQVSDSYRSLILEDAGVVALPVGSDNEYEAYDARSGERLYELDLDDGQILESNGDTAYIYSDGELKALDARTGKSRWRTDSFENYRFAGGSLIAHGDPDDDELLVGFH